MVKNSLILREKELLSFLGDIITEQTWEEDAKTLSYAEFLEKYTLKDTDEIKKRYEELRGEGSSKVIEPENIYMGECYELIENPAPVSVTSDKVRNYVFETEELSGWDTGEDWLEITFKLKPRKDLTPHPNLNPKWDGVPPVFFKFNIEQNSRTPDIRWGMSSSHHGATGSGDGYIVGPISGKDEISMTLKIPSNPMKWATTETNDRGQAIYNWPRFAGLNGSDVWVSANIQLQIYRDRTGDKRLQGVKRTSSKYLSTQDLKQSECNAYIYLKSKFSFGTFGDIVWQEFIKNSPWTDEGENDWDKSPWNYRNWDHHVWLDIFAIAALIVAGFFSGGAGWAALIGYYGSMLTYAGLTLVNAASYYKEGNTQMAGIHLLFEALPYTKFLKRLKNIPSAVYSSSLKNAFKAIKYVGPGGFKTNKNALKLLKGHPYAADMVKSIAKYGDDALMSLKGSLKGGIKPSGITNKVANEFIEAVAKESPAIARRITTQSAKKIIAEQARTFTKRLLLFLQGAGNLATDALILATLYDADMVWQPFQMYVLGREGDEVTTSGWPGLRDIQDYTHKLIGKTATEQSELLQSWFGEWRVRDLIVTAKDEKGSHYNWPNTRALYILAVANPMIENNKCDTIPSERHTQLYEKYKYEPYSEENPEGYSEEEKMKYDAKQMMKSAGDFQGVPIAASKMMYDPVVNLALKEDFINGWRPEQNCHEKEFIDGQTEIDLRNKELVKLLVEKHGPGTDGELWYKEYLTDGLRAYKQRTGEYLKLGGVEFRPEITDAAMDLLTKNFDDPMKHCLMDNMLYYKNWETIPEGEDVDFSSPEPPCKVEELLK